MQFNLLFLYYWFLLFKLCHTRCADISLRYVVMQGRYYVTLNLISTKLQVPIDMTLPFSFTTEYHYSTLLPSGYNTTVELKNNHYKAAEINELIRINNSDSSDSANMCIVKGFKFYLFEKTDVYLIHNDGLAFPYKLKEPSHSLVSLLYDSQFIKHRTFAFTPHSKYQGVLHFGNATHGVPNTTVIKVDPTKPYWGNSGLRKVTVTYNHSLYTYNTHPNSNNNISYFYFQASKEPIYVPQPFWDHLVSMLSTSITRRDCWLNDVNRETLILCFDNATRQFNAISFHIEESMDITIQFSTLFTCVHGICQCGLRVSRETNAADHWIFGTSFLSNFLSVFDYDGSVVTLQSLSAHYTIKPAYINNNKNNEIMIILFKCNGVLLTCVMVALLLIKYLNK